MIRLGVIVALLMMPGCSLEPVSLAAVAAKQCEPAQVMPVIPKSAPAHSTYLNADMPPARFQTGEVKITVEFVSSAEANRRCAAQPSGLPVCGRIFYGCVQGNTMILPNPCETHGEQYAKILCHETGHRRGWPATHGD